MGSLLRYNHDVTTETPSVSLEGRIWPSSGLLLVFHCQISYRNTYLEICF